MTKIEEAQREYFKELTQFTMKFMENCKKTKFTGNMMIHWSEGNVTNFMPKFVYGVSTIASPMAEIFDENGS